MFTRTVDSPRHRSRPASDDDDSADGNLPIGDIPSITRAPADPRDVLGVPPPTDRLRSWIVTRYEDVKVVLAAPTMSSDRLTPFYASLKDERRDILSGVMRYLNLWLVFKVI